MPELPEVNTVQQYFNGTSLHQRIASVEVRDGHVLRNLSPEAFREKLCGRAFTGSYRRGKFLFGELDNGHYLQLHLGMTGDLVYYQDEDSTPRFARFILHFDNGAHLAFDDPRKFGRIVYIEHLARYLDAIGLGEDALRIDEAAFLRLASGKKSTIKGFLLNQRYLAGVGNLYADEILYQTRIHPASRVDRLSNGQLRDIFRRMQEVLHFAVERDAHYRAYPEDWLWQWREEGRSGPEGHGVVRKTTVAGRTTYYCEGWQTKF